MDNNEALLQAIAKKDMKMFFELMHQPGIDLNYKNKKGKTPLTASIRANSRAMVKYLIDAGCDVNLKGEWKTSPLYVATAYRRRYSKLHNSIIYMLTTKAANVNAPNFCPDYTPLHRAVLEKDLEVTCMLLYYGADVNITNSCRRTPLMEALCDKSRRNCQELLLNYYDDFSCSDYRGNNALHLATVEESPFVVDLVERGADVNSLDEQGRCLIYKTGSNYNAEAFKFIYPRIKQKLLLNMNDSITPFLLFFLERYYHISNYEYLECLYLMLESFIAQFLIKHCIEYLELGKNRSFVYYLLKRLVYRKVSPKDRLSLIYACMSFGAEIKIEDLQYAYELDDSKEEFKALIYMGNFICDDYVERIRDCMGLKAHYWYTKGFSSLPLANKQQLITTLETSASSHKRILKALHEVPEFPSLLEISRNEAQKFVQHNFKISKLYQFFDAVNSLKLPKFIKDVILLQTPIYTNLESLMSY